MTGFPSTANWIPERLVPVDGATGCRWVDIGDTRFTDPFFEMTLDRRRRDRPPYSSTLQHLYDVAAAVPAVPPCAIIFHVSRCGSTLVAQLFGCDPASIVLSEVPVLDQLLRSDLPDREVLFSAALRVLGRPRFGESKLFVKADAWHLYYADTLRRLYPEVPFVLLYRSPDAVLESHRRARGMHLVPGLLERAPFAVPFDADRHTLDQYAAAVLEGYYRTMLDVAAVDPRTLLVSYEEGFPAAFERIAAWLGLPLEATLLAEIRARCAYDGKRPQAPFSRPDAAPVSGVDVAPLRALFAGLENRRVHVGA